MYLKIFSTFLLFFGIVNSNEETHLRNNLFSEYNKYSRPTKKYNQPIDVRIGLAVQNIESFDQIHENIELNVK